MCIGMSELNASIVANVSTLAAAAATLSTRVATLIQCSNESLSPEKEAERGRHRQRGEEECEQKEVMQ